MSEKTKVTTLKKEEKRMLVENIIHPAQALKMAEKTPAQYKYTRPAKGGGEWTYVKGGYVKQQLNYIFGYNWDFTFTQDEKYGQVITQGKLVVKDAEGRTVTKMQVGRADIKFKKAVDPVTKQRVPLDYGNDAKASATDALKKCASELGIASDVYEQNEFIEVQNEFVEGEGEVDTQALETAISDLMEVTTLDELHKAYMSIPAEIRNTKQIADLKDKLKEDLTKK